jgi:hypothetical protein
LSPPKYYFTKLAELRIKMIAKATKDATIRSKSNAKNAAPSLGQLKKSDMDFL